MTPILLDSMFSLHVDNQKVDDFQYGEGYMFLTRLILSFCF